MQEASKRGDRPAALAAALAAACTHTYGYENARLQFKPVGAVAAPDSLVIVVSDADCARWHEEGRALNTYKYAYGRLLCSNIEPAFAGVSSRVARRPAGSARRDDASVLTVRLGDLTLDWGAFTFSDNKAVVEIDGELAAPAGSVLWTGHVRAQGVGNAGFLKGAVLGSAFGGGDKAYEQAMVEAVQRAVGNAIGDLRAAVVRELAGAAQAAAASRERRP